MARRKNSNTSKVHNAGLHCVPWQARLRAGACAPKAKDFGEIRLVLQLCINISAFFIVRSCRPGLVSSAPKRPLEDEGYAVWRFQDELCQEISDFRHGMNQIGYEFQAAIVGLVLFGLLQALRRRSAANLARNAAAAMTRLIWRCQPCQDRASQ